jgi:hypothetical protein
VDRLVVILYLPSGASRSWRFGLTIRRMPSDMHLHRNSISNRAFMYRHFISAICLLTLLGGQGVAPFVVGSSPKACCGCRCPKSNLSCCCRKPAGTASHRGPVWSAETGCQNRCHCITVKSPRPDKPLPSCRLRVEHWRAHSTAQPMSLVAVIYQSAYLRFLYQRPPPSI